MSSGKERGSTQEPSLKQHGLQPRRGGGRRAQAQAGGARLADGKLLHRQARACGRAPLRHHRRLLLALLPRHRACHQPLRPAQRRAVQHRRPVEHRTWRGGRGPDGGGQPQAETRRLAAGATARPPSCAGARGLRAVRGRQGARRGCRHALQGGPEARPAWQAAGRW